MKILAPSQEPIEIRTTRTLSTEHEGDGDAADSDDDYIQCFNSMPAASAEVPTASSSVTPSSSCPPSPMLTLAPRPRRRPHPPCLQPNRQNQPRLLNVPLARRAPWIRCTSTKPNQNHALNDPTPFPQFLSLLTVFTS